MTNSPQTPEQGHVRILYATMTGNTRDAVEELVRGLKAAGVETLVTEMRVYDPHRLANEGTALLLTSTFGNGDPPDQAYAFWDVLRKTADIDLSQLRYSVLALGDSAYPRFCQFGIDLDARLEVLKARRIAPLQTCDVDWEEPFGQWREQVMKALVGRTG